MIIDLILYLALFSLLILLALPTEKKDLMCPQGPHTTDPNLCREGNGKSYFGSHPLPNDSSQVLLEKIEIAAKASKKDVIWRRCYIFSLLISLLFFLIVIGRFPAGKDLFLSTVISVCVLYFAIVYYRHHHYAHIEKNILDSVTLLRGKSLAS